MSRPTRTCKGPHVPRNHPHSNINVHPRTPKEERRPPKDTQARRDVHPRTPRGGENGKKGWDLGSSKDEGVTGGCGPRTADLEPERMASHTSPGEGAHVDEEAPCRASSKGSPTHR